ncbi:MAG: hypothetical protein CMN94_01995 [Synechococcus sp. EAC657]|nr:hypothetical protein [Synechococcus sp. EAC657]|tara:strand:+ start:6641 stop:6835 length:195 start_codon:yes stop_codon:yes gene_type:complete
MVTNNTIHSPGEEVATDWQIAIRWAQQGWPCNRPFHETQQKKSPVEDEGFEWCEELVFHQPPSV